MNILFRPILILSLCISIFGCAAQKSPGTAALDSPPALAALEQDGHQPAEAKIDITHTEALPAAHEDKVAVAADDDQSFLDTALELTETAQEYWEERSNNGAQIHRNDAEGIRRD